MSDPAIEASRQAWVDRDAAENDLYRHQPILSMKDGSIAGCQCMDRVFYRDREDWGSHLAEVCSGHMESAAREALKPIRELHKPFVVRSLDDETWTECETCHGNEWPCETAKKVYTSEELS